MIIGSWIAVAGLVKRSSPREILLLFFFFFFFLVTFISIRQKAFRCLFSRESLENFAKRMTQSKARIGKSIINKTCDTRSSGYNSRSLFARRGSSLLIISAVELRKEREETLKKSVCRRRPVVAEKKGEEYIRS